MELKLYSVSDGDNVINKDLGTAITLNIMLKADTDIISPSLILTSSGLIDYNEYNYAHIPLLKRYYFITDLTNINNKMWKLQLECDVIETYKNDILASKARLQRNIKTGDYVNAAIDTNAFQSVALHKSNVTFSNDNNYILTAIGE